MTLSVDQARSQLLRYLNQPVPEKIKLEAAFGRILASPVQATTDFPPFDRSPLDGFALKAEDVLQAQPHEPVCLQVVAELPAGHRTDYVLQSKEAVRIMTGAPIPQGATGVVRLEDTKTEGNQVLVLRGGKLAARNICRQGEEFLQGAKLLEAGLPINRGVLGLMALLGQPEVWVYKQPVVAILATGSELVGLTEPLEFGKIRNSNSYLITGQVLEAGAHPWYAGIVPDNPEQIAAKVTEAAKAADVVITTGGVSVGDYDYMPKVYEALGIEVIFHGVAMKPGMPTLAGHKAGKLFIGLSGNPASAAVAFEQLVRPALLKLQGCTELARPWLYATLEECFPKPTGAVRYIWGTLAFKDGLPTVKPASGQGNGMLLSSAQANCLIVIPAQSPALPAGIRVKVQILSESL